MFCCWISRRQFIALPSKAGLTLYGMPLCLQCAILLKQESWHQICHKAERYMCDFSAFLLQTIPSVSSPPASPTKGERKSNLWLDWKKRKGEGEREGGRKAWGERKGRQRERVQGDKFELHKCWKLKKKKPFFRCPNTPIALLYFSWSMG